MEALSNITLDLQRPSYETVYAAPLDCDTRGVVVTLVSGSIAWTPPAGTSAAIEVKKPDGSFCVYDTLEDGTTPAYSISSNTVTILWAEQALTAAGQAMAALRFYNAAGKRLSTFTFRLVIPAGAVSDAEIESTDYFSLFTRQAATILAASVHSPTINATNLHWMLWDSETEAYVDSGYRAIIHSDAEQAEAWAVGERGGQPVGPDDPTYHNNAKYYAEHGGGGSGGPGLTADIKAALLQLAAHVAYIGEDGQDYYDALYNALYPPANLVSISAVYTQSGTVYDTDSLNSLKTDLVVTAVFSDSSTETLASSAYTLSGTLNAGTSTITVSYGGKTTTFTVTVTHVSETVIVYFADLTWEDTTIKKDGTTASLSRGHHLTVPYYDGMEIHTTQNTGWVSNYPPFLLLSNGQYTIPEYETISASRFKTTLTGLPSDVVIYVNWYGITTQDTTPPRADCFYTYTA